MLTVKNFKRFIKVDRTPQFKIELKNQSITTLYRVNTVFEGNLGNRNSSILVMKTGHNFVLDLHSTIRYRLRKNKEGETRLVPTNGTSPELTVKDFSVVRGSLVVHEDQ